MRFDINALSAEVRAQYEAMTEAEQAEFRSQFEAEATRLSAEARTAELATAARTAASAAFTVTRTVPRNGNTAPAPAAGVSAESQARSFIDNLVAGRTLSNTATSGAELIPEEYVADILKIARDATPLFSLVTQRPMTRDVQSFPVMTSAGESSDDAQDEGADYTVPGAGANEPSFELVELTARKYGNIVGLTDELISDAALDAVGIVKECFGRDLARKLEKHVFRGTGVKQPVGILTTIAAVAGPAYDADLAAMTVEVDKAIQSLFFSLKGEYREKAVWATSSEGMAFLNTLQVNGVKLMSAATNERPFATILGRRVLETSGITATQAAVGVSGATSLVLGDFSKYVLGMRKELTVKTNDSLGFKSDTVLCKYTVRYDGKPAMDEAFKVITLNISAPLAA